MGKYSKIAILFHWAIAIPYWGQYIIGQFG